LADFIALIASFAAVGGLIFTGFSFWRLGKTEELKLLVEVYRDIARSLREYNLYAESPTSTVHTEKEEFLLTEFFSDVNWLCYLIRHGQIKDDELIKAFRDQIITWYGFFKKSERPEVVKNITSYPDFKYLYPQMKLEIENEIAFNKKYPHIAKLKKLIRFIKLKLKRQRYY
jgi:hypothetical protein